MPNRTAPITAPIGPIVSANPVAPPISAPAHRPGINRKRARNLYPQNADVTPIPKSKIPAKNILTSSVFLNSEQARSIMWLSLLFSLARAFGGGTSARPPLAGPVRQQKRRRVWKSLHRQTTHANVIFPLKIAMKKGILTLGAISSCCVGGCVSCIGPWGVAAPLGLPLCLCYLTDILHQSQKDCKGFRHCSTGGQCFLLRKCHGGGLGRMVAVIMQLLPYKCIHIVFIYIGPAMPGKKSDGYLECQSALDGFSCQGGFRHRVT